MEEGQETNREGDKKKTDWQDKEEKMKMKWSRKSALHAFLHSTTVQSNFSCITCVTSFSHT